MKKILSFALMLYGVISLNAQVISNGTPHAMKATTGIGLYKERIFWINWDLNDDKDPWDLLTSPTGVQNTFVSPSGISYKITISNLRVFDSSGTELFPGNANYIFESAPSTSWSGNNFPSAYSGFPSQDIISLTHYQEITPFPGNGNRVTYRLAVEATEPAPKNTIGNARGIVIAGSESLNGPGEYYQLDMPGTGLVRLIDKYIKDTTKWTTNFDTRMIVTNSGNTIKVTNPTNLGDSRGDLMLLAENVPYIDCDVKGGGGQHIAIGFIEQIDISDAPSSYGTAAHIVNDTFTGGQYTTNGNVDINKTSNTADIASPTGQLAKLVTESLRLGTSVDVEDNLPATTAGQIPLSDDNNNTDDENGISSYQIYNALVPVTLKNTTGSNANLYIWIDANRNGVFDTSEFVSQTIPNGTNGVVNVNVNSVTAGLTPNRSYYMRLRLTSDVLTSSNPAGYASDGEVEDYLVAFITPDTDGDGIPDVSDIDDDNDGIPDTVENGALTDPVLDANSNGLPNYLDPSATGFVDNNNDGVDDRYDTDLDGTINQFDLDSDNDGCLDAIEGGASIVYSQLVSSGGIATVGTGSPASNQNLCGGTTCVNAQGLPQFTPTVPTNYSNTTGQTGGTSYLSGIGNNACKCFKPAATGGTVLNTNHGITALVRAGEYDGDGNFANDWPMVRKGAWTALEAKSKGFVVNRVPTTASLSNITNTVEGMMVYDEEADCLKIYTKDDAPATTYSWRCFGTQTCPDVL